MNCPQCNSANMMPVGKLMWCQDCHYAGDASAGTQAGPAAPSAIASSTGSLPALRAGMMSCPVCSHRVSMQAASCPSCGQPLKPVPVDVPDVEGVMQRIAVKWILRGVLTVIIANILYFIVIGPVLDKVIDSYIHSR